MIDHVSIPVRDLERSAQFYEAVLAPLGLARLVTRETTVGFGKRYPEFWLNHRPEARAVPGTGYHLCLRASDMASVRAFHEIAIRLGGSDEGAPGERKATMTTYFAAFILDPDGNKIEAASFLAASP
jgi:catechol 2,3-dioxygenase-like lactoylglutathione lyase family enzyme